MAMWGKNDSEASKPNWLTEDQKRNCIRTVRGWEIPLPGMSITGDAQIAAGIGITGVSGGNLYSFRSPTIIGPTELLVCMAFDPSPTGSTNTNAAGYGVNEARGACNWYTWGKTAGNDLPDYAPYFTTPLTGTSYTFTRGVTSYIPLIVVDANITDNPRGFSISITGPTAYGWALRTSLTNGTFADMPMSITDSTTMLNQPTQLVSSTPTAIGTFTYYGQGSVGYTYNSVGGWSGLTTAAAALRISATGPTGSYVFTASVSNGSGLTGSSRFTIVVS